MRSGDDAFTPVEELQWRAQRIEAVAKAVYMRDHPDRSWDFELALLDTEEHSYSLAPRYRWLADVAIATTLSFGEFQ